MRILHIADKKRLCAGCGKAVSACESLCPICSSNLLDGQCGWDCPQKKLTKEYGDAKIKN